MYIRYKRQLGRNINPVRHRRVTRSSFRASGSNRSLVSEIDPNEMKRGEVATVTPPKRGRVTGQLHEPPSMRRRKARPDIRIGRNAPTRERKVPRRRIANLGIRVSPGAPAVEKFRQLKRSGELRIATG